MVKHTQTIRRLLPTNCLSLFDHFVGSALKGLTYWKSLLTINPLTDSFEHLLRHMVSGVIHFKQLQSWFFIRFKICCFILSRLFTCNMDIQNVSHHHTDMQYFEYGFSFRCTWDTSLLRTRNSQLCYQ